MTDRPGPLSLVPVAKPLVDSRLALASMKENPSTLEDKQKGGRIKGRV